MSRIGLSIDELVARTWSGGPRQRYLARVEGLDLLMGEVVALVGPGAAGLRKRLEEALPGSEAIDGAGAAGSGALRIRAMQAARIGSQAVVVSDPLRGDVDQDAASLALADLAGMQTLGLTTIVELADVHAAALVADRVVVVTHGYPDRAYPVLAARPRRDVDVQDVTQRALARLPAA